MPQKILIFFSVLFLSSTLFSQQTDVELKITNPKYEIGTSTLIFSLEFVNHSSDTLSFIKPLRHFFDKNYDFGVDYYPQLKSHPYKIKMKPTKKCQDEEVVRMIQNLNGTLYLQEYDVFTLYPKASKVFNEIKLEMDEIQFCNKGKYTLKIEYTPEIESSTSSSKKNSNKLITQLKKMQQKIESKSIKCAPVIKK